MFTVKQQLISEIENTDNLTVLVKLFEILQLIKHPSQQHPLLSLVDCIDNIEAETMRNSIAKEFNKKETADLLKSNKGFEITSIKALLLSMPNVGEDEDFARHQDLGRECEKLLDFVEKHRVKVDCISIPNREERNAR